LEGTVVHPKTYETALLREDIIAMLRKVTPHAQALGGLEAMEHLEVAARTGSDATILRKRHRESGSAHGLVETAMELFRR
jgi:carboxylate-amine ligase